MIDDSGNSYVPGTPPPPTPWEIEGITKSQWLRKHHPEEFFKITGPWVSNWTTERTERALEGAVFTASGLLLVTGGPTAAGACATKAVELTYRFTGWFITTTVGQVYLISATGVVYGRATATRTGTNTAVVAAENGVNFGEFKLVEGRMTATVNTVEAGLPSGRGYLRAAFEAVSNLFGRGNIKRFWGNWNSTGPHRTNCDAFWKNMAQGMSQEQSALNTPTGKAIVKVFGDRIAEVKVITNPDTPGVPVDVWFIFR
tara:strand:- start:236 stop:1006 length:771 start_codon:yes stop_codon:yes gene_type:complete